MVLKTSVCRFSGLRIYPGKGILFVRVDSQQYLFLNRKCKSLYAQKKRPAKLLWTTTWRKAHKKDQVAEVARKKRRTANKGNTRSIVGVSLEVINKTKNEKPEVRKASREAAIREVKERAKKLKAEKAAQNKGGAAAKPAASKVVGRGKR